jgi:hypothetical protein
MTIPASQIANSTPSVLSAGGSAIDLSGMFLTNNTRAPIGSVLQFATPAAVQNYFGASSPEAAFAGVYFAGPDTPSSVKPGNMLITQFNTAPVAAYLRGGNAAAALTLTQLQSLSGTLSVTIDGSAKAGSPNLSGSTSFTNAAQIINQALGMTGAAVGSFTGSIATTTLTVTAAPVVLAPGQVLSGVGVTAGTYIVAQLTGTTGGIGTYQVSASQTVASESITATNPGVVYDSVSGAFIFNSGTTGATSSAAYATGSMAASLLLTQVTGAVLSQGAAAASPAAFMTTLANAYANWATFGLMFNPDQSGSAIRLAFSSWASQQKNRFIYVASDDDISAGTANPASSSFGFLVKSLGYGATIVNWQATETYIAALVMGFIASMDFSAQGGRYTLAGRTQAGFPAGVVDVTFSRNLIANGYNFYGAYATAKQNFIQYQTGAISGQFLWADSAAISIWLTNNFQVDMMVLLQNLGIIPYNTAGNTMIEEGLSDTITQAGKFGAYQTGVSLSGVQKAAVTAAAGQDVSGTLSTQGWYLAIGNAPTNIRQQRGSPPCKFFYMDGESVQTLQIDSVVLQ